MNVLRLYQVRNHLQRHMHLFKIQTGPVNIPKESVFDALRKAGAHAVSQQQGQSFSYIKDEQDARYREHKNAVAQIGEILEENIERGIEQPVKVKMQLNPVGKSNKKTGSAKNKRVRIQKETVFSEGLAQENFCLNIPVIPFRNIKKLTKNGIIASE